MFKGPNLNHEQKLKGKLRGDFVQIGICLAVGKMRLQIEVAAPSDCLVGVKWRPTFVLSPFAPHKDYYNATVDNKSCMICPFDQVRITDVSGIGKICYWR